MTLSQILAEKGCYSAVMSHGEKTEVRKFKNELFSQIAGANIIEIMLLCCCFFKRKLHLKSGSCVIFEESV